MAFWANNPSTLPAVPQPDQTARVSELGVHFEWPSAEDSDRESSEAKAPTARGFFLGQLSGDHPNDEWAGARPRRGEGDRADLDGLLEDGAQQLDHLDTSIATELQDPVEIPAENERSCASEVDEPARAATDPAPPAGGRAARRAARDQRAKGRRLRVAFVAAGVVVLVAGTSM